VFTLAFIVDEVAVSQLLTFPQASQRSTADGLWWSSFFLLTPRRRRCRGPVLDKENFEEGSNGLVSVRCGSYLG